MRKDVNILFLVMLLASCATVKKSVVQPLECERNNTFKYYFYEAERCLSMREFDRGMALLLYCEQLEPEDAAIQQALGYMYQATEQTDKALDCYRKAFDGDRVMYWSNYASLLFELGRLEESASVLEEAASLQPKDVDILEALSTVYSAIGNNKKALKVQDRIESLEGINSYNALRRYKLYLSEGRTDKAIEAIERYLAENPDDLRFRVFRADLSLAQGKEQQAMELYKQELRENPNNPYVYVSLSNYCASKGELLLSADNMQRAVLSEEWELQQKLKALQDGGLQRLESVDGMALQTLTRLTEDYPIEESVYQMLAQYYIAHKDYRAVRGVLQTMLDINSDNAWTWQTSLHVLQTDTTTTNEEYEVLINEAYKKMPDDPKWAYWKARVLLFNGDLDSALCVSRNGAEHQGDVRYRLGLRIMEGDICNEFGDMEGAYKAYESALKIDPNNVYVLNNYAYMLATHGGDIKKAEQMSQKTIESEPDNATYLDTYAWILHLQNQDFLANYYIEKALSNMKEEESEEIVQHYKEITGKEP